MMIFADDFRKPAYHISARDSCAGDVGLVYIEFISINIFQLQRDGILSCLSVVNITDPMRCEVCMAMLI